MGDRFARGGLNGAWQTLPRPCGRPSQAPNRIPLCRPATSGPASIKSRKRLAPVFSFFSNMVQISQGKQEQDMHNTDDFRVEEQRAEDLYPPSSRSAGQNSTDGFPLKCVLYLLPQFVGSTPRQGPLTLRGKNRRWCGWHGFRAFEMILTFIIMGQCSCLPEPSAAGPGFRVSGSVTRIVFEQEGKKKSEHHYHFSAEARNSTYRITMSALPTGFRETVGFDGREGRTIQGLPNRKSANTKVCRSLCSLYKLSQGAGRSLL